MKKLLALLLALTMLLSPTACSKIEAVIMDELKETIQLDPAVVLRQNLVEYSCGDLRFYLSEEFEQVKDLGGYVEYATEDLKVAVSGCSVSGGSYDISDGKAFAELYIRSESAGWDSYELEQAYGTWYVHAQAEGQSTRTNVTGFYVENGYGWFISVEGSDCEQQLADMIHYATLGQVVYE